MTEQSAQEKLLEDVAEWLKDYTKAIMPGTNVSEWAFELDALSLLQRMQKHGVVMKVEDQTLRSCGIEIMALTDPRTFERIKTCGFVRVQPLLLPSKEKR
jgi:hypothetical protein